MHPTELRRTIRELLEPTVERLGFDLVAVEMLGGAGRATLRLSIDAPGGVGADDCARVTHRVSPLLDEADPIASEYRLEVSSPGLDRVLRTHAHFERFAGERVKVEMMQPVNGRKRFQGRLQKVEESEITLEMDGGTVSLPIEDIHRARLVPEI